MSDENVARTIQSTILDDPFIKAPGLAVQVKKGKGFFNRRKVIHVTGTVQSDDAIKRINDVATKWAGDRYDVSNEVVVKKE